MSEEERAAREKGREVAKTSLANRGFYAAKEGAIQGGAGIMAAALHLAGDPDAAKWYEKAGQDAAVRAQAANELHAMQSRAADEGVLPSGVLTGAANYLEDQAVGAANSVGQMLPGMAVGIATGNTPAALTMMALPVFGQSFIARREAGGSPAMSAAYAGAMAGFEVIGETYGLLPQALNAFRKEAAKDAL